MSITLISVIVGSRLLLAEVLLAELEVGQIHGQTALVDELLASSASHLAEAVDDLHLAGHRHLGLQRVPWLQEASRASTGLIT